MHGCYEQDASRPDRYLAAGILPQAHKMVHKLFSTSGFYC